MRQLSRQCTPRLNNQQYNIIQYIYYYFTVCSLPPSREKLLYYYFMGSQACFITPYQEQLLVFHRECNLKTEYEQELVSFARANMKGQKSQTAMYARYWEGMLLPMLCENVSEWHPGYELSFCLNQNPNLLLSIQNIKFSTLKKLNLEGNNLTSVETLSRIWLPYLDILQLGSKQNGNHITSIAGLRKMCVPFLFDVVLYGNKVKNPQTLPQMGNKKIRFVYYEHDVLGEEQACEIRWLAKLKTPPDSIDITCRRRIVQREVWRTLKKRNQSASYFYKNR